MVTLFYIIAIKCTYLVMIPVSKACIIRPRAIEAVLRRILSIYNQHELLFANIEFILRIFRR